MALERQTVEKKDFPIGRRGYDPDAVDTHLTRIADEVDELKRQARRRGENFATAASEQVRAIVEAAETSAAEIERRAEEDAAEIRAEAGTEARLARERASDQAREHVSRVSESASVMLQRLEAMETELSSMLETVRTGANRVNADLQLLEGNLSELDEASARRSRFELDEDPQRDRPARASELVGSEPAPAPVTASAAADRADQIEAEERGLWASAAEPSSAAAGAERDHEQSHSGTSDPSSGPGSEEDDEAARLIALNMALNNTSREETDRYLAENFQLSDRRRLVDEVYASVGA